MPLYEYECEECAELFERFVPFHLRNDVKCSKGHLAKKLISLPRTEKDKTYEFYSDNFGKDRVWVRSKTHYHKLRKQNNIIDANFKESFQEARIKRKSKEESLSFKRKKTAKRIADRLWSDGFSQTAPQAVKNILNIKDKKEVSQNG